MRAARFHAFGGPDQLRIDAVPEPHPGAGEVLVRVAYAGVNPVDAKVVAGQFPAAKPPRVPGADFAGTVAAGEGLAVGTRVVGSGAGLGVVRDGAYAEYVTLPAASVVALPDSIAFERAAALGVVFLTSWLVVFDAGSVRAGETVLVHGAGGAVGQATVQLAARSAGAKVIAVVSGDQGAAHARTLGASETIDRTREDVATALARLTGGRGADVVVDVVGGKVFEASVAMLAPRGRLVSVGVSAGQSTRATLDIPAFYRSSKRIAGVSTALLEPHERGQMLGEIVGRIARGEVSAPDVEVFPLERAADALTRTLSPEGAHGKLVLRVAG